MNSIFRIHKSIVEDYKSYVNNFIQIKNDTIRETVQSEIDKGKLWPEPLIQFNSAFEQAEREKVSRSIFAQHAIQTQEIEKDLKLADQSIGSPQDVESFVVSCVNIGLGAQIIPDHKGYQMHILLPD